MKNIITTLLLTFLIASCGKSEENKKEDKRIYHRCVNNGVEYFKEIGSYPTLKSAPNKGKHALEVARERCKRAPKTAFPEPN